MDFLSRYSSQILGVTRIVSGLAFLEHGTTKLLNFPAGTMHPPLTTLPGAGGVIELVAGALILLGLFSRWAALIASGEMAVPYFLFHMKILRHTDKFPPPNGGAAALPFCFSFLSLWAGRPRA